jgi:spermidine synthase
MNKTFVLLFASFSIIYEFSLSYLFSVLAGNTIFIYSLVVGIYLFFLGLGTFIFDMFDSFNSKTLLFVEILISLVAIVSPYLIYFSFQTDYFFSCSIFIISLIAFLTGFEIPFFSKKLGISLSSIISWDYLGNFIGSLLFSLILIKYFSIFSIFFIVGFLNIFFSFLFFKLYN